MKRGSLFLAVIELLIQPSFI